MEKQPRYVIDVRKSEESRKAAENINRMMNRNKGSKYMRPSFAQGGLSYQNSHKK